MKSILGPVRSRLWRRSLLAVFSSTALLAAFIVMPSAGAAAIPVPIQNTGLFQLDGNTLPTPCTTPSTNDWAGLYNAGGTSPCGSDGFSFIADGSGSADKTYWSAGGSKDAYDPALGPWLWKPNDVSPDKNDIVNAFAAEYHVNPSTDNVPVLFFGSDRFNTNGDAQMGYQFLQANTCLAASGSATAGGTAQCPSSTPVTAATAGHFVDPGTGAPVHHMNGDILVLVNFNKGGTLGLAGVFEWQGADGSGAGSYVNVLSSGTGASNPPADCTTMTGNNDFCATASTSNLTNEPVWPFTVKGGGTTQGTYAPSSFVEGGVNLSRIPGAGTCFPSFLAETRSSAGPSSGLSLQAQLKDLAFGKFQNCKPSLTTQASTNGTVTPGTAVHDTAAVTISGASSLTDPTGNVTFYLCPADSSGTCTSAGTSIGTGALVGGTADDGIATATSPDVNTAGSPLGNGYYCFQATWPGDSTYGTFNPPVTQADNANECFQVLQHPTSTVTDPQSPSGTTTHAVSLNTSVVDHAVVTDLDAGGGAPTGAVNFYLCNPGQVTGTGTSAHCAGTGATGDGSAVTGNPVALTTGSPTADQSEATSGATSLNQLGVWCFRATYVPSGSVFTGSSGDDNAECVTVTTTSSANSLQKWLPNDHVNISTNTGDSLSGTLDISLRSGTCNGTLVYQEPAPYNGSDNTVTVPIVGGIDTTNTATFVNAANNATPYFWRIVFAPNSSFATGFTKCETTTININNNP